MKREMGECEGCGRGAVDLCQLRPGLAYMICGGCGHCAIDVASQTEDEFERAQDHYFGHGSILLQAEPSAIDREILETRLKVISARLTPHSRVLEVGPGAGFLAQALKHRGYILKAIEHSPVLAQALRERFGLEVETGAFESHIQNRAGFDAFCSFHVIEHVPDPLRHLQAGFRAVQSGGLGFVATPNAQSWQQRLFPRLSPNFDEAHSRVFSPHSLKLLCVQAGWEVVDEQTPEYTSAWLRVLSKGLRRLKHEDEVGSAGKYAAAATSRFDWVFHFLRLITSPARLIQRRLKGGNELFFVLRKPVSPPSSNSTRTRTINPEWSMP